MYRFNLQPVLDYRQIKEENILLDFSALQRFLAREESVLVELRARKAWLLAQLRANKEKADCNDISFLVNHFKSLLREEEKQSKIIKEIIQNLARKKGELLMAMKDRKVLDTIKNNRLMKHRETEARTEMKINDELATLKHEGTKR